MQSESDQWILFWERIPAATVRNTMFVHLLVWDERYAAEFLGELLAAIFDITTYCEHVTFLPIHVHLPTILFRGAAAARLGANQYATRVPYNFLADAFEREMTRVSAKGTRDTDALQEPQFLYLDDRRRLRPKLRIRRVVEEDNDDAIPIIGGESTRLGELYGPYYISEMIRHPDGCRQLIIGEDADGSAAGVVCLDSAIDVDQLNENFELTPHHGLRKTCEDDETSADVAGVTSELVHSAFARHDQDLSDSTQAHKVAADEPRSSSEENGKVSSTHEQIETTARAKVLFQSSVQVDSIDNLRKRDNVPPDTRARSTDLIRPFESKTLYKLHLDRFLNSSAPSSNDSQIMSLSDLSLISDYFDTHFQSRLRETIFSDATFQLFQEGDAPSVIEDNEVTRSRLIHNVLPHPTYHGEINAFVLEIFAARKDERPHWSRDFLEAAFDCFPHLDYCAILLPSFHPYRQYLQHFVRVPLRCNKDFPMMLYVAHRAAFCEEIKCRRGQIRDRKAVEELLLTVPTRQRILADFDLAVDLLQPDLDAEKQVDFIRSYYHVEDHVSMQSIRQDEYGRLLHFVLMPIFSAYHRFFFREIARLSELTVIFYRLHHEDESISTRVHSLVSCLSDMIPVNPRRQANYKFPITLENIDNSGTNTEGKKDYDDSDKDRFSLFVISPRLAMMPRTIIDMRIVVVGASDCGVAFAEYLALRMTAESQIPWNCLTVNDDTEAFICLRRIQWLTGDLKEEKAIFFYGRNIDCYSALNGLIDFGVKPAWITLIEPRLNPREAHADVFFHDCEVDEAMMNAISRSGVQVLSQWDIIDCSLTENDDGKLMIESVTIEKEGETRSLVCDALFNFHEKTINLDTFLAFSHAGLVFDGLLVIDPEYRTNDPFIFAAGTVTKYSRKFYTESCRHAHYNSVEIGERLAQILRKVIDIHRCNGEIPVLSKEKVYSTLPVFRAPVVIACILPGDHYYLHVRKPGERTPHETEISHNSHIFQVHDMIALYGKHESMLNELKFRFRSSSISDFYACFREPWAAAIFYDKFECLRVENRATLLSRTNVHGVSLVDDCVRALIKSKWKTISEKDRRYIVSRYAGSVYHQELEENLVKFLEFCEDDLPMYCTWRKQRQMYMDIEESPLYFEQ
ncbi:hypothetical protein X777_15972 [Ooceraea biroi]|uniref:Uncharacterized protein n=1 Tax=Ooceraea biroi TaxID=2015173 RepID=A0A026WTI8_OOCBI|nr:hypothetical protein X777_15972 [Ooceraea biroi]